MESGEKRTKKSMSDSESDGGEQGSEDTNSESKGENETMSGEFRRPLKFDVPGEIPGFEHAG